MTEVRFWQASAALPIVVPVASWPLLHATSGTQLDVLTPVFAVLAMSIFIGGIPYVLVAGLLLWALRHKPAGAYRRLSLVVPLIFAAVLFVGFAVYTFVAVTPTGNVQGAINNGTLYGGFAVPIGYLYVGLAHAAHRLLVRHGLVVARSAA